MPRTQHDRPLKLTSLEPRPFAYKPPGKDVNSNRSSGPWGSKRTFRYPPPVSSAVR